MRLKTLPLPAKKNGQKNVGTLCVCVTNKRDKKIPYSSTVCTYVLHKHSTLPRGPSPPPFFGVPDQHAVDVARQHFRALCVLTVGR